MPFEEISYWVAGINHFSWFLDIKWHGESLYPRLREVFKDPEVYLRPDSPLGHVDLIEVEMMKTFGYFTSGGGHLGVFLPYFRRTPELLEKYKLGSNFESYDRAPIRTMEIDEKVRQKLKSGYKFPISREHTYTIIAVGIINSIETGTPAQIYGNVKNNGLITNLLKGCVVEVPCLVDKEGIHPCYIGDLPTQLAALNSSNVFVQEMAVRGIAERDKNKILQSILLDPLNSAMLSIDEIKQMVNEMFEVEKEFLQGFK